MEYEAAIDCSSPPRTHTGNTQRFNIFRKRTLFLPSDKVKSRQNDEIS